MFFIFPPCISSQSFYVFKMILLQQKLSCIFWCVLCVFFLDVAFIAYIHDPLLGYCHLEFLFDSCQPHNSLGIIGLRYLKIQSSNMWTVHIYQMPQGRLIQKDPPFLPCHFPYTPKFNIAPQK